jgi:hypothetical protein
LTKECFVAFNDGKARRQSTELDNVILLFIRAGLACSCYYEFSEAGAAICSRDTFLALAVLLFDKTKYFLKKMV